MLKQVQSGNLCGFSQVKASRIDWLWEPYIAHGKITILQGNSSVGKTALLLNVASLLSNGLALPEGEKKSPQSVIFQSGQDCAQDIKRRLLNIGADCSKIAFIDDSYHPLTLTDDRLEIAIRRNQTRLLVLDSLQDFIVPIVDLREQFKQLEKVAARTKCAIVITSLTDVTNIARNVLSLKKARNNPVIHVMSQLKNSLAPQGIDIAFEINELSEVRFISGRHCIPLQ
jgi:RecA-family ATPase